MRAVTFLLITPPRPSHFTWEITSNDSLKLPSLCRTSITRVCVPCVVFWWKPPQWCSTVSHFAGQQLQSEMHILPQLWWIIIPHECRTNRTCSHMHSCKGLLALGCKKIRDDAQTSNLFKQRNATYSKTVCISPITLFVMNFWTKSWFIGVPFWSQFWFTTLKLLQFPLMLEDVHPSIFVRLEDFQSDHVGFV